MKKHQAYVEKRLLRYGKITRNHCLSQYISRLASIINRLRVKYDIEGAYKNGDFVYTLRRPGNDKRK